MVEGTNRSLLIQGRKAHLSHCDAVLCATFYEVHATARDVSFLCHTFSARETKSINLLLHFNVKLMKIELHQYKLLRSVSLIDSSAQECDLFCPDPKTTLQMLRTRGTVCWWSVCWCCRNHSRNNVPVPFRSLRDRNRIMQLILVECLSGTVIVELRVNFFYASVLDSSVRGQTTKVNSSR